MENGGGLNLRPCVVVNSAALFVAIVVVVVVVVVVVDVAADIIVSGISSKI